MSRQELLAAAVLEAARAYMAEHLRAERDIGPADLTPFEAEALQTLRDALARERAARVRVARRCGWCPSCVDDMPCDLAPARAAEGTQP